MTAGAQVVGPREAPAHAVGRRSSGWEGGGGTRMGTWGPGNFENDCAADHLYQVCGPLLKQVEEAMKYPSSIEPDEYGGDIVPANLEIIACLSEHLGRYERGELADFLYPCVLP